MCGFIPLSGPARRRDVLDALAHPLLDCLVSTELQEFLLHAASCRGGAGELERISQVLKATWVELGTELQCTLALSSSCLRGCVPNECFCFKTKCIFLAVFLQ